MSQSDKELEKWLNDDDKKEFPMRLERLKFLLSLIEGNEYSPFPNLTAFYYEEARRCWVMGCFLPTIMMARLTFQNWLLSHFWGENRNTLTSGEPLREAELSELIEEAVLANYISQEEAHIIHHLDDDIYQPYVRPVDRMASLLQQTKLRGGASNVSSVEEDARGAISILCQYFPLWAYRTMGR